MSIISNELVNVGNGGESGAKDSTKYSILGEMVLISKSSSSFGTVVRIGFLGLLRISRVEWRGIGIRTNQGSLLLKFGISLQGRLGKI